MTATPAAAQLLMARNRGSRAGQRAPRARAADSQQTSERRRGRQGRSYQQLDGRRRRRGLLEGTFVRYAADLGKALDDGDNLRVLPIVSYGAVGNVSDLIYLKGIDIAIHLLRCARSLQERGANSQVSSGG